MQHFERGFVAGQAELALQLDSGHAGRVAGEQVSAPEPRTKRYARALHYGAGGQCRVFPAFAAPQDAGASGEAERLALFVALRAGKAEAPAGALKIGSARRIVGEHALKVWQRTREGDVVHSSISISLESSPASEILNSCVKP